MSERAGEVPFSLARGGHRGRGCRARVRDDPGFRGGTREEVRGRQETSSGDGFERRWRRPAVARVDDQCRAPALSATDDAKRWRSKLESNQRGRFDYPLTSRSSISAARGFLVARVRAPQRPPQNPAHRSDRVFGNGSRLMRAAQALHQTAGARLFLSSRVRGRTRRAPLGIRWLVLAQCKISRNVIQAIFVSVTNVYCKAATKFTHGAPLRCNHELPSEFFSVM
jgi:hypothetical protein